MSDLEKNEQDEKGKVCWKSSVSVTCFNKTCRNLILDFLKVGFENQAKQLWHWGLSSFYHNTEFGMGQGVQSRHF